MQEPITATMKKSPSATLLINAKKKKTNKLAPMKTEKPNKEEKLEKQQQ